jgi:hypothetical protein
LAFDGHDAVARVAADAVPVNVDRAVAQAGASGHGLVHEHAIARVARHLAAPARVWGAVADVGARRERAEEIAVNLDALAAHYPNIGENWGAAEARWAWLRGAATVAMTMRQQNRPWMTRFQTAE